MRVSVVICTYNRANFLPRTLRALEYVRYPQRETIVVVGPCTDDTMAVLARWSDRVRIVRCPEANLSMARNLGIAAAAGDLVAFTDDDGLPEANWLDTVVAAFAEDPGLGAVGGFVRDHTGIRYQTRYILCNRWGEARFFDAPPAEEPGWFVSLIGVNSVFRRSALQDIGGFDEEFAYFLDETDVCLRLLERGWRIRVVEHAEVHHAYAPSHLRSEERVPTSLYLTARSKVYFALRHLRAVHGPHEIVARQRADLLASVKHLRSSGKIDEAAEKRLRDEIWRASADAARDAFAYPNGRVVRLPDAPAAAWVDGGTAWQAQKRQRVLLLSRNYPPQPMGGIARYTQTLAHALAARGHEVHVVAETVDVPRVDFEDGVWVHRIGCVDAPERWPALCDRPPLPNALRRWTFAAASYAEGLRKHLGVTNVIAPLWDVEAYELARKPGWRVMTYLVTSYALNLPHKPDWQQNSHYLTHHVQPVIAAEGWLLRTSNLLLASTRQVWEDVQAHYGPLDSVAMRVVPFGIADDPVVADVANAAQRGIDQERACESTTVLFVGRFERRKGIDLMLEAVAALAPHYPDVFWRFIGNDALPHPDLPQTTYRAWFEQQHAGASWLTRVRFEGEVNEETLLAAYRSCDLLVAPSRYESFGLIYLEAMRAGKPCIGGCNGGGGELITPEVGVAVATDSAEPLIAALRDLLDHPEKRAAMGRAARQVFEERYKDSVFAQRVEAVLAEG
ncbi:glycosyltransferase [Hydrogenophilus hirschii]